jgi:hypothetical protein
MGEIPHVPSDPSEVVRATTAGPAREARAARGGPAFEALLERLEARAAELEEKSNTLAEPEQLPEAVDAARASLEEALRLGEELLEAYRAARRAPEARP